MPRTRGLLFALLVLPTSLLAGCSDEAPPLAQPTDRVVVPSYERPVTPTAEVDFEDPGLTFDAPWQVGDEWDYESNTSAVRQVRVSAAFTYQGLPHYLVTERTDRQGHIPSVRRYIVQGEDWLMRNTTDSRGYTQEYDPGIPLRLNRNATYFYNVSVRSRESELLPIAAVAGTTRYPANVTLQFPWGFVEAAKIEHRIAIRPKVGEDQSLVRQVVIHYPSAEFLNDVMIMEKDETWRLIAAKVGDFQRGRLLGT